MKKKKILTLLFLQFLCINILPASNDSLLFIEEIKKFAFKEIQFEPNKNLFSTWTTHEKPYVYLYVSLPDKIKMPMEVGSSYIFCGTDEEKANKTEPGFKEKGYHTFRYKTYANSSAFLNEKFLSYSKEAIAFIVFHELIHNYIIEKNIRIPYEFNEALCDVIGNYGTLKFSQSTQSIDLASAENQIKSNENIYTCLNSFIAKINKKPKQTHILNDKCNKRINTFLKKGNTFQKDRFEYKVNNAYLLKNEYYCKNYFLLKKVFLKQKTIKDFLKIIKTLPETISGCEVYLKNFI